MELIISNEITIHDPTDEIRQWIYDKLKVPNPEYANKVKIVELRKPQREWYKVRIICEFEDESEMQVMRRTCGYIGTNFWNKGRTAEIGDRVLHL